MSHKCSEFCILASLPGSPAGCYAVISLTGVGKDLKGINKDFPRSQVNASELLKRSTKFFFD